MHPELFRIGPVTFHSFGLMLALAFIVCGELLRRELVRRGLDGDLSGTVVTWAVIGGVVGARLYYLVEHWREVQGNLFGSVFSGAGLVAYGGFAGGILAALLAVRRQGASVLAVSDAAAPLLALGYAIGRIGCLLAGDGDYGPPSSLPWAMAFPDGYEPTLVPVHPTPLYETIVMLGVFALLWRLRRRNWPAGALFAAYLVLQGIERFVIEWWRRTPVVFAGLTTAQIIGLLSALCGAWWLARSLGRRRPDHRSLTAETSLS